MSLCFKCLKPLEGPIVYGLHSGCFSEWFNCSPNVNFKGLTPHNSSSVNEVDGPLSFFHGKFKKYTAKLLDRSYVLKVVQSDYPNLPRVEFVSNLIARALKIKVPDFYLIKLENQDCFVSRHFLEGTQWQNLTHIFHFLENPDKFDVESLKNTIFKVTQKPQDIELFFQTLLFDSLIGNHDRHGRNLAILSQGQKNRLSPIYDNPSYIGIENLLGADLNPTGRISTKSTTEPTMKDYMSELKTIGAENSIKTFNRKCSIEEIEKIICNGILENRVKSAFLKLVKKRYEEFKENF